MFNIKSDNSLMNRNKIKIMKQVADLDDEDELNFDDDLNWLYSPIYFLVPLIEKKIKFWS